MPIFDSSSPFDEIIEKATLGTLTSENWDLVVEINDRVNQGGKAAARDCLLSLKKRLNNRDPHVILLALAVLDSCVCNCGKVFQQEVCTHEFLSELRSKATGSNTKIAEKTRQLIKKWCDDECKSDPSLSLMPSLLLELKRDGYEFTSSESSKKATQKIPADPNYVTSQQEADELARAIQLSLKESESKTGHTQVMQVAPVVANSTLYPSSNSAALPPPQRVVKALYDFEAAEDNELTFKAGELITVTDDTDANWWKGSNFRGEGLFPASFVTADLSAAVIPVTTAVGGAESSSNGKKKVQFDDNVEVKTVEKEPEPVQIDEDKLNHCLQLLQDADPTGERPDPEELKPLEDFCLAMGPLIDREVESIDRQHNQLSDVNAKLMDALNLYHSAMKDASAFVQSQFQQMQISGVPQNAAVQQVQQFPQTGTTVQQQMPIGYNPPMTNQPNVYQQPLPPHLMAQAGQVQYSQPQQMPMGNGPQQQSFPQMTYGQ